MARNISLKYSPLTEHVYAVSGRSETDVTNDFIFCVLARWNGFKQIVREPTGKQYEVSVKEIKPEDAADLKPSN